MCIIAVIADVQVGHLAALWPENFVDKTGKEIKLTRAQKVLTQYWEDYWSQPEARDAEYIFNMAESIEGNNRKEYGRSLVEVDLNIQKDAYIELTKNKVEGKKVFGLAGSGYHTSLDYDVEESITKELGGTYYGAIANLKFKTGHIIFATHKAGNAMLYKSTMLDRNSLYCQANKRPDDPNLLLYAHHHQYFTVGNEVQMSAICPSGNSGIR